MERDSSVARGTDTTEKPFNVKATPDTFSSAAMPAAAHSKTAAKPSQE
jgi:hypothetical protein